MQTMRDPDTLSVTVVRHPFVLETSLLITHIGDDVTITVYDDWSPVPDRELGDVIARAIDLWARTGPLAAAAYLFGLARLPKRAAGRRSGRLGRGRDL